MPQLQKAIPVAAPFKKFLRVVIGCLPCGVSRHFPWPVDCIAGLFPHRHIAKPEAKGQSFPPRIAAGHAET
jgi:hypothetical protein